MDVHRCRFVSYPPSTINALAFSHSSVSKEDDLSTLRLAIGRANGDIEIWNPQNGSWSQETVIHGGKDRSVDGLVWTQDPDEEDSDGEIVQGKLRLFSIGYTTTVTEWNLETGEPLRQSSGNHGEIWCLAAQPRVQSMKQINGSSATGQWGGQNLVTGCIDGAVVLYTTKDEDLMLHRTLARPSAKRAKVISIVFQDRNMVVAGCTDSKIRIYDTRNGTLIRDLSLGGGPIGGPRETIVWAIKCLPNGNIVSGDSTGELKIWDGRTYTLTQRVKSHRQDILSLATSLDGSTIFSGGMDRRTVVYKQIGTQKTRWAEVTHKRFHNHDVKAMASFEGHNLSIVVSGGPDSHPIVTPLREFGLENQRMLPSLPQDPVIRSAPQKRLMMSWWDREIHLWRLKKPRKQSRGADESESESEDKHQCHKHVAKILIKGEAGITDASITQDGSLVAVSTSSELKLFQVKSHHEGQSLKVSKVDLPGKLSGKGAKHIQFSPDGNWIAIILPNSGVVLARIVQPSGQSEKTVRVLPTMTNLERLDRKQDRDLFLGSLGRYNRVVSRIAFSADSRILAVSDLAGYIDTWVLEGQEDVQISEDFTSANDASQEEAEEESDSEGEEKISTILGQQWIRNPSASLLPKLPASPVVLSFRPSHGAVVPHSNGVPAPHATRGNPTPRSHDLPHGEGRLLVVTATSQIYEFDVLRGALSNWSRKNPTAKFPDKFKALIDQTMGCVWDIGQTKERLWLYGSKWLWMFDLSRNFPTQTTEETKEPPAKKRKRNPKEELRHGLSGAGGKIPDERLGTGISRKMQSVKQEGPEEVEEYTLDRRDQEELASDDDDENDAASQIPMSALDRLRQAGDVALQNGNADEEQTNLDGDVVPHWWYTFKYRPIMGIVPLGESGNKGTDSALEVALVERPEWELDLPPRYYGDQEWDKSGL